MRDINGFTTVEYFDVQDIKEDFSLNQLQSRVSTGGLSSLLPRAQDSPIYIGIFISLVLLFLICMNTQGLNAGIITCFTGKVMDTITHITSCLIKEPKI
jgi:hypothetical protein|tara:strand:- start:1681 stop:1977 length:297 start_codon:yes stop_codon:yes gene_type:complete